MSYCGKSLGKMIRPLMICLVFFMGGLSLSPAVMAEDRPVPVNEITVAVGQDYAPFYFRDQKGVANGWLVDIWRLWAQKTGINVRFVTVPFGDTLKLTGEGKVDVQGGCFYSKQRATYLDYVAPLAIADTHFFFHNNIYGIETLKDLVGFRIGVIKGDFCVGYLRKNLPGAGLAEYATNEELFKTLEKGEVRVFVMDTPIALYFLEKWKLLSSFNYYPGRPLYSNALRAAVKKGDTVLPPVIKDGLAMISPKEKASIERRWGASQTKTEGVLTIACDRYYPPFTMLTPSGRAAGILIDFWRLWSEKNIRKIEFVFDDWEKTIQLVKEGKADIHAGLFKTRAREEFLSFSAPVFAAQDNLAFKKDQKPLSLNELSGETVGVIAGSAEETELKETHPDISLSAFVGYRDLFNALQREEVLAIYDVGASLQRAIEELGLQGEIQVSTESGPIRDIFAGVLKKNSSRLKGINQGISEITEQEIRDIEARWVSNPDLRLFSGRVRPLVLTAEEKQWLKEHPRIRLGIDSNFMPFEAFGQGGIYEGISSSYVSILSEKLGVDMKPVEGLSWQEIMDAAMAGEVDVLPCLAMTKKRSEFLQFTHSYLHFQVVAVTREDAPFIADLNGLKGSRVAVVKGYYVHDVLERDFPEITLVPVNDIEQGLEAVADGKAAAYVDISASIIYAIHKLGLKDLKVAATTPYDISLRFGVRKDWPELATILEKALRSIPEKEREKIANRWINVRFANRTDWALLIKVGIAAALIIGLILAIILFWNRRLSREVGERARAEQEYMKSERKVKAMSQAVDDALVMINGKGEVMFWNHAAEDLFGYTAEEAMGGAFHKMAIPEGARVKAMAGLEHFSRTGEGAVIGSRLQVVARNRMGKEFPVELSISSFQMDDEWFAVGTVRDISERNKAEEALRNSEERSLLLLHSVGEGIFGVDGQGRVTFINPAALNMLGFSEEELLGNRVHSAIHHSHADGSDYPVENCPMYASCTAGTENHVDNEVLWRKDGASFPVEYSSTPMTKGAEIMGAVVSFRDITDRLRDEQELNERLGELEQFSRLVVGREEMMMGLKEEINSLLEQLGQEEKYKIVE